MLSLYCTQAIAALRANASRVSDLVASRGPGAVIPIENPLSALITRAMATHAALIGSGSAFFPPRIAGESGIGRFFRYWGGEALYGMHEPDPVTSPSLRVIGRPCLVEAEVPVASLGRYTYLTTKVARRYLDCQGFDTQECMDHEGCAL